MYTIESTFEKILPVWKTQLWPGRMSEIKPHSAMKFLGGYDMAYFANTATFILAIDNEKIIGCLSGHRTEPLWYRSRGLWVDQSYRKNNVARTLISKLFSVAKHEGCTWVWTVPRVSSMQFYEKVGFIRASKDFDEGVEFGPNCYAVRSLC